MPSAGPTRAKAVRDFARPMVALYGGMGAKGPNFTTPVRRYGYEEEAEKIQDLYLDGHKKEAAAVVPDAARPLSLCGDEGYVRERIQAFKRRRRHQPEHQPDRPDPVGLTAKIKEGVVALRCRRRAPGRRRPR